MQYHLNQQQLSRRQPSERLKDVVAMATALHCLEVGGRSARFLYLQRVITHLIGTRHLRDGLATAKALQLLSAAQGQVIR